MRIPMYLMCVALLVSSKANNENLRRPLMTSNYELRSRSEDLGTSDDNYFLPRLTDLYKPSGQWNGDTHLEQLFDTNEIMDQEPADMDRFKRSREMPSLSIINPMEVLRNRVELEMNRRRFLKSAKQIQQNREFMNKIGKRMQFFRSPQLNEGEMIDIDTM